MSVRLYSLTVSHPSVAAHLMLAHKRINHRVFNIQPGAHPVVVRAAGFPGRTVPALDLDGRLVQGSRAISRVLDEYRPDPALFPRDLRRRDAVEVAESWGEEVLQPMPRRMYRWGLSRERELRRRLIAVSGMPAPGVTARLNGPLARMFAGMIGADDEAVQADLRDLPARLDHLDTLIADGVVGGDEPSAADFQIAPTVRVMLSFDDLRPLIEGRPAASFALRLVPAWPDEVPPFLPKDWIPSR
jgi:glutathione S-transferase